MSLPPCTTPCPRRRQFLHACLRGAATVAAAPTLAGLAGACGAGHGASDAVGGELPTVPNSPSGTYSFAFADYPALQRSGGALMVNVVTGSGSVPVAIVRLDASDAAALDATCTHLGCTINPYDSASQTFTCACHGSRFGQTGAVERGPAARALTRYAPTVTATGISATIS